MNFPLRTAVAPLALISATPSLGAIVSYNGTDYTEGQTIVVNFNGVVDGTVVDGLTSTLNLTFTGVSDDDFVFHYVLDNTSSDPITGSTVTGFGFSTDPNANIDESEADGTFIFVNGGSFPQGRGVEVCFVSNQDNNCQGAGNGDTGALFDGDDAIGDIILDLDGVFGTLVLSDFHVRYQAIDGDGFDGDSGVGDPTGAVPEPATWAMMLMGFGAVGYSIRRRRKTTLAQVA